MSTRGKSRPKPDLKEECIILGVGLILLLVGGVLVQSTSAAMVDCRLYSRHLGVKRGRACSH